MARYASQQGLTVTLNTNGLFIDRDALQRLSDAAVDTVYLSIDGACARTYENIRRDGRFSDLLRALGVIAARQGSAPEFIAVPLLMRLNLRELRDIVRLAAKHGS